MRPKSVVMPRLTVFFLLLCCSSSVRLQAQIDTTIQFKTLEIAATHLENFAIGQAEIRSDSSTMNLFRGAKLADFLQSQSMVNLKTYGSGLTTLSMRGMSASHTAIIWNGINIQNALNGNNDAAILSVAAAEQITVQLGGNSALAGSGAIAGTIRLDNNLLSDWRNGLHAQIGYTIGAWGEREGRTKIDFGAKHWFISMNLQRQTAKNDFLFRNTAEIGQPLQQAQNANFERNNQTLSFTFAPTPISWLKINVWRSQNYRAITPTMTAATDNANLRDTADRLTIGWGRCLDYRRTIEARVAYLSDKNTYNSNNIRDSRNNVRTWVAEAALTQSDFNHTGHDWRIAANMTNDRADNNNYQNPQSQRTRLALVFNEAYKSRFIHLSANIRQEWVQSAFTPPTFSIGASKKLSPRNAKQLWTLRGSWSRNFNLPSLNDLYWANLGNPDLQPEQGWSGELGVTTKHYTDHADWSANLTLFDLDIQNRIVWLPQSDGQFRPTNLQRALSRGIECWGDYTRKYSNGEYKIRLSYQFVAAEDGNGGAMLYVPAHKIAVSTVAKYRNAYASWQQTASDQRFASTDRSTFTAPFTTGDVTLGITTGLWKHPKTGWQLRGDWRLQVNNIFDSDYQVIPYYPNPKRQWRIEGMIYF